MRRISQETLAQQILAMLELTGPNLAHQGYVGIAE
jgi:hypothetical protein